MTQVWSISHSGNETLRREHHYNYQAVDYAKSLAEFGHANRLVVIDDDTDKVIFEYTPVSWQQPTVS